MMPLNLISVVGTGGVIGNVGEQPEFPDRESAMEFRAYTASRLRGGVMIIGGRSYQLLVKAGYRRETVPWETHVWDRELQGMMSPEELVENIADTGRPGFLMGGAYTFASFMPWVGSVTILRASLTVGGDPVYMPELFPRPQ